jgi:hypothetical protein
MIDKLRQLLLSRATPVFSIGSTGKATTSSPQVHLAEAIRPLGSSEPAVAPKTEYLVPHSERLAARNEVAGESQSKSRNELHLFTPSDDDDEFPHLDQLVADFDDLEL